MTADGIKQCIVIHFYDILKFSSDETYNSALVEILFWWINVNSMWYRGIILYSQTLSTQEYFFNWDLCLRELIQPAMVAEFMDLFIVLIMENICKLQDFYTLTKSM